MAHIVATKTNLLIATGPTLNDAIIKAKKGDVSKTLHGQGTRKVKTEDMLEATGLNLGSGVVVNELVPGDVG